MEMDRNIAITYNIDTQHIQNSYYASYGALDEEFAKELDNSIAHNMRHFAMTFDHEKMTIHNVDKNETNTFLYQDLYQIKKTEQGYLFFINNSLFYFVKFDLFQIEDLVAIDNLLKPYYEKHHEIELAVIENYQLDEKRTYAGLTELYANSRKVVIVFVILVVVIFHFILQNWYATISLAAVYCLLFFIVSRVFRRINAKKIVNSLNNAFRHGKMMFYEDRLEMIAKAKIGVTKIKYSELYKIKKTKKGYLLLLQKYSFYFFFFDEFTPEQCQQLEERFKQCKNYR